MEIKGGNVMAAGKSSRVNRKYKTKCRIRNWREYERGLRSRGDVTIWLSEEAIAACVRAGEKLGQERRESGGPWRSKNRPPEICLRKRSQEERFVGYRRDVHSGAICTRSARGLC